MIESYIHIYRVQQSYTEVLYYANDGIETHSNIRQEKSDHQKKIFIWKEQY